MRVLFFFFSVLIALSSFSQTGRGYFSFGTSMTKPPASFRWVKPGLSALETEVTVDHYLYFLQEVSNDSTNDYIKSLIPSEQCILFPYVEPALIGKSKVELKETPGKYRTISWIDQEKFKRENYTDKEKIKGISDYYYNPYFLPLTGISYEQASEYARWCTARFNSDFTPAQKKAMKKVFIFRLATPEEYEFMIKKGIESCTSKDPKICAANIESLRNCKNEKGCALCNCAQKDTCAANKKIIAAFGENSLHSVESYFPNWLGLYNLMGNAAEMTSVRGTAKGGSYFQPANECQPASVQTYSSPQKWLGLRLVAEVKVVDVETIFFDEDGFLHF